MDYTSIFGELTRTIQITFDKISEKKKTLFDTPIYPNYLSWGDPMIGLDFEALIGKYNITIAAPTIGEESKEPVLGTEGLETLKERVLNHALTIPMKIQTYRKVLQILDSRSIPDKSKAQTLINLMMGDVQTVVNAVMAKIDLIFLGALSNDGKFALDDTTNPEGGARGTISFNQPADNIANATTEWTSDNIDTVDCFEDIQSIIDAASDKVVFGKILCDPSVISYICRTKKIKQMVFGSDRSASILTTAQLNSYMETNGYPIFVPIRRLVRIQDGVKKTQVKPWNVKNIVFVPDGQLGVIENAYSNNELKPEAGVSYSNYGRIRVSKWGVGETQNSNGVEFTKAESLSLPVITEMDGIYTLHTQQ